MQTETTPILHEILNDWATKIGSQDVRDCVAKWLANQYTGGTDAVGSADLPDDLLGLKARRLDDVEALIRSNDPAFIWSDVRDLFDWIKRAATALKTGVRFDRSSQADAWEAVFQTCTELEPHVAGRPGNGQDSICGFIRETFMRAEAAEARLAGLMATLVAIDSHDPFIDIHDPQSVAGWIDATIQDSDAWQTVRTHLRTDDRVLSNDPNAVEPTTDTVIQWIERGQQWQQMLTSGTTPALIQHLGHHIHNLPDGVEPPTTVSGFRHWMEKVQVDAEVKRDWNSVLTTIGTYGGPNGSPYDQYWKRGEEKLLTAVLRWIGQSGDGARKLQELYGVVTRLNGSPPKSAFSQQGSVLRWIHDTHAASLLNTGKPAWEAVWALIEELDGPQPDLSGTAQQRAEAWLRDTWKVTSGLRTILACYWQQNGGHDIRIAGEDNVQAMVRWTNAVWAQLTEARKSLHSARLAAARYQDIETLYRQRNPGQLDQFKSDNAKHDAVLTWVRCTVDLFIQAGPQAQAWRVIAQLWAKQTNGSVDTVEQQRVVVVEWVEGMLEALRNTEKNQQARQMRRLKEVCRPYVKPESDPTGERIVSWLMIRLADADANQNAADYWCKARKRYLKLHPVVQLGEDFDDIVLSWIKGKR